MNMSEEEKPIPNPEPSTASAEKPKKRGNIANIEKYKFKPGQSGNPLGPVKTATMTKRLSRFSQLWGRINAPDDWFGDALAFAKKSGLSVDELIAIRVKYCLATNTKYVNTSLLVEELNRREGKIPLKVLHKDQPDGTDEFESLTDEELKEYAESIERRAAAYRDKEDDVPGTEEPKAE